MSPVADGKPEWFALRRGEVGYRLDPHFHRPRFRHLIGVMTELGATALGAIVQRSDEVWVKTDGRFTIEFPYIEISAVGLGTNEYTVAPTPFEGAPSRARQVVKANDILVSLTRPHRGAIAVVRASDNGSIASTGFAMLRNMKRTDVNRDYLLYTLGSRFGLEQLLMRSSGGSYPAITEDELDRILIPIPDERKQRELVAAMDAARSARRVKLAKADALLADMDDFVIATLEISPPPVDGPKVFALPSSVCRSTGRCDVSFHLPYYRHVAAALKKSDVPKLPLGELSPEIVGGATPTKGSLEFYADSGIKFLRILNVKANEFDLSDLNFIKPEIHQGDLKRSQLDAGDVLMTITGRVGNAAVVTQDLLPANINQHIVRLRIVLPDVLPEYLAAYLNTSIGLAMSNRGVTGGTRIALDYGTIRALSIPMPSLIIQRRIAEDVARRREQARRLRQQADAEWQTAKTEFEAALLEGRK